MSLRLPLIFGACGLFWTLLGTILGVIFRHALGGLILGLLFGVAYTTFGSWAADKFPLDVWEAKLLENAWAPNLYDMLRDLSARMDVVLPTLYSVPRAEPNAFVVAGRDGDTAIAVTNGLTRHLEKDEVQAVLALMMARLATGAMPAWTVAATLAGLPMHLGVTVRGRKGLAWLGDGLLALFAFPAAWLARLAWSEGIVVAADDQAAHLAERPDALASALAKIAAAGEETEASVFGTDHPATSLLFAAWPPPDPPALSSFQSRASAAFPGMQPDVAERQARFLREPASPVEPN